MISFRLRTKWQKCRGYVPSYERTPKIPWLDIHSVFATQIDTTKLASLLDEINKIDTSKDVENDIIGRGYEYFLSKFAIAEGKGKGEFLYA